MPGKATGQVMGDRVWERQRNGTWYCFERSRVWRDGRVVTTGKRLLGKADERGGELRPTRPKRRAAPKGGEAPTPAKDDGGEEARKGVEATRTHTGMCDILEFVGSDSGIDEDLRSAADGPTADKLISLARYLVATDGQTFPGIEEWQLTHPVPYGHPITEDVYGDLFREVGTDESLVQGFFRARVEREDDLALLVACDSTTVDSETKNPEASDGTGKSHTGKRTVKLLVLYSMTSRRPLAYAKQPGNVPDVISVDNALKQLQALTDKKITLVTDVGYASEAGLGAILHAGQHVLTRVKVGWKWVREQVDAHLDGLGDVTNIMDCDVLTKGVTVTLTRELPFKRVYASKAKGLRAGDTDHVRRRVHLHLYYDQARKEEQDRAFWLELMDVRRLVEEGTPLDERAEGIRDRYLKVIRRGKSTKVEVRKEAASEACRLNGVFALATDNIRNPNRALEAYRQREWIEDFNERLKQDAGGHTARTGSPECLNGRLFTQFLAMCYIEDLHERVREMKSTLGRPNGDAAHDLKESLEAERGLRRWLEKRSLWRTLVWFDAHDTVEVSTDIRRRRWSTETVRRDRLFLERLGVTGGAG